MPKNFNFIIMRVTFDVVCKAPLSLSSIHTVITLGPAYNEHPAIKSIFLSENIFVWQWVSFCEPRCLVYSELFCNSISWSFEICDKDCGLGGGGLIFGPEIHILG